MEEKKKASERPLTHTNRSTSPHAVPTIAFALSLAAGVLFLLAASMPLVFRSSFGSMGEMMGDYDGAGMMDTEFIVTRIVGLAFAGVVLYAAILLNSRPAQHVTWGTLILTFAVLSVFTSWAGFGIGLILGVIGGALAIAWRPTAALPPTASTGRFCLHCGRGIALDASFCSYCGQQLPE